MGKSKALFIILSFFLLQLSMQAQTIFQKMFYGASAASGWHAEQTSDNGFIICGNGNSIGPGGSTFLLIKTDANGDTLWTKMHGGAGGDNALCVKQTSDGGYIASGGTYSFGAGNSDGYLVKTNGSGTLQWSKTFGGIYNDDISSVQQTTDGGYILLGSTASFGGSATDFDVFLIRTNSIGDTLWTKRLGGSQADEGLSIDITSDNGFIIAGSTKSFGMGGGQPDVYMIKTDSTGNVIWSKTYGGSEADVAWSVKQTLDGGYITAGTTHSTVMNNFGDLFLMRTDANGDTLWTKAYGGTFTEQGYSVQQTADGGFIVLGETYSFGVGQSDIYLLRTDGNGIPVWAKTYGSFQFEHAYSVRQTNVGGYIITGTTNSFGGPALYLLKTDGNGTTSCNEAVAAAVIIEDSTFITSPSTMVSSGCMVSTPSSLTKRGMTMSTLCFTVGMDEAEEVNSFLLYPNPTDQNSILEFENPRNENILFSLYDGRGSLVGTMKSTGDKLMIERKNLRSGVYFFRLNSDAKIIASGKLVFE